VSRESKERDGQTRKKEREREKRKKLAKANLKLANVYVKIHCSLIYNGRMSERTNKRAKKRRVRCQSHPLSLRLFADASLGTSVL
jgi:hypothetical protein